MKLLLKHSQSPGRLLKVQFKLWGQIEFEGDEREIVTKYKLDDAVLIAIDQQGLIRNSALIGVAVAAVLYFILPYEFLALIIGAGTGYLYFNEMRETVYVKNLIYGRYFSCGSVIDLAKRERWLHDNVAVLRQVMEAARHWDGTEAVDIPVLDRDAARELVARL